MNKYKNIIFLMFIPVGLFALMFVYSYYSAFGLFYQQCEKIRLGMEESEVKTVMAEFILNDKSYTTTYNSENLGKGIFIYHDFSGNRCRLLLDEDNRVKEIIAYFE